ncbi:hypothetical protein VTK73DRAFT_8243 [Phialemonium thermophilum]|uniref:Uncharacterized protein n=1 Tax=Phialemonium thermophilum TaxID=223376 RepID=A0ABR3XPW9_9PEZI
MLILRGYTALFLVLAFTKWTQAVAMDRFDMVPLAGGRDAIPQVPSTPPEALLRSSQRNHEVHPNLHKARILRTSNRTTSAGRRWRRGRILHGRDENCSLPGSSTCLGTNGTIPMCLGCRDGDTPCGDGSCRTHDARPIETGSGESAGAVTVTHTITSVTAGNTLVAVSTVFETITLVDPAQSTQTITVVVTSFLHRRSVAQTQSGESQSPTGSPWSGGLGRRQDLSSATPATELADPTDVTTTVYISTDITTTIRQTSFVTTTIAPNAIATVFVTSTTYVSRSAATTLTETMTPTTKGSPVPSPSTTGPAATVAPTIGRSSGAPMESGAGPSQPTSSAPEPSSTATTTSSSGSLPVSSATLETMVSMMSMMSGMSSSNSLSFLPTGTGTAVPGPTQGTTTAALNSDQIAGVALGAILFLFFLIALAFLLRWAVRRRRSRQAELRQRLSPPGSALITALRSGGSPGGLLLTGGSNGETATSGAASASGLTGQGEVRIVIRPAPKRRTQSSGLWPMPPGHRGQTYSFFVEETTTGETTPQDPGAWSIASERGSIRNGQSQGEGASGGTAGATSRSGSGEVNDNTTSLISIGWGTSLGQPSQYGSGVGLGANLAPPPPTHDSRRWRRSSQMSGRRSTGETYNPGPGSANRPSLGSFGIGNAI